VKPFSAFFLDPSKNRSRRESVIPAEQCVLRSRDASCYEQLPQWRLKPYHSQVINDGPESPATLWLRQGYPWSIHCGDPRSQKRDLGHPSRFSDTVGSG
jgi:hypothetical protein